MSTYNSFNYHEYNLKKMTSFLEGYPRGKQLKVIGTIKAIIYKNSQNGYSVYTLSVNKYCEVLEFNQETKKYSFGEEVEVADNIRVVGYSDMNEGQTFSLIGNIDLYNGLKQLSFKVAEYLEPSSEDAIIAFLGSGLVKGIGEKTAIKIVKGYKDRKKGDIRGFGDKTLEIIKNNPMALTIISGISKKKAKQIHETYMKNIEYQNVMFFFQKYNITPSKIMKIYKTYKEKSIEVVKENPFILTSIKGFGFKVVDEISRKLGLDPHSMHRIRAGIIYTLKESETEGHCFLTDKELIDKATSNLDIIIPIDKAKQLLADAKENGEETITITLDLLTYQIDTIWLEEEIRKVETAKKYKKDLKVIIDPVTKEEIENVLNSMEDGEEIKKVEHKNQICIYTKELYEIEYETAMFIRQIAESKTKELTTKEKQKIEDLIVEFEKMKGFSLEKQQKEAIRDSFKSNLILLIGSAGTGKTTVSEGIIYVQKRMCDKLNLMCTAPTGRASKRISEVTMFDSKTIHRLLEYKTPQGFNRNEFQKLEYDMILCDEFSMSDIRLSRALFSAIDTEKPTKLLLMGDAKQLPSVGAGNVLKDMAESGKVLLVELDVVKRQAEGSSILDNAYRVIRGESLQENKGKHDFLIVYEEEKERVADKILLSIKRLLDKSRYNYTIDDIQVICPQRTSEIGTDELNRRIQELVNPPKQSLKEVKKNDNCTFRVGDKVMHMANDYEKVHYKIGNNNLIPLGEDHVGIFNGDMGRVIDVIELPVKETEDMEENLVVKYDNFVVIYNREELQDIELSYAMSIHKSQGAQFKVCLIPFHFRNYKMLNRNLGYTALTRAEEIACVFGQKRAMDRMCKNIEVTQRNTRLKYLI